jgi:exodeoxyribonuclease-3
MRVLTINLNGIRSAKRKGFFEWLALQNVDVICMQELRADEVELQNHLLPNYHVNFVCAEKKGYSGVAIYSRYEPKQVIKSLGWSYADTEGRYVAIDVGPCWIASIYLPSGTSGEARQAIKFDFLARYFSHLQHQHEQGHPYIICGDLNIAHTQLDLKNWRANQKNSGFLPDERAWLDKVFTELGFVDAFRVINQEGGQYTWWSNRGRAWENNVGWRIDYQVVSPELKRHIKAAHIFKEIKFSDHAPLIIDYDITF